MKAFSFCSVLITMLFVFSCQPNNDRIYLFNGKDLSGWDRYLGIPDSTQHVPGLERNADGSYTEALGLNNDPLQIFTVTETDGAPAIRIDGYIWGGLITSSEYSNYHLHLDYKWGEEKHPPREHLERNSGVCYHSVGEYGVFWTYWMRSFEIEVKETALGDFVRVDNVYATVETRVDTSLSQSPRIRYQEGGNPVKVNESTYMVRARDDFELPQGQWNSIDLYVFGDAAMHVINDEIVMLARELQQRISGELVPLTAGKIQLQSEGAEIYYRDIWIEPLEALPGLE